MTGSAVPHRTCHTERWGVSHGHNVTLVTGTRDRKSQTTVTRPDLLASLRWWGGGGQGKALLGPSGCGPTSRLSTACPERPRV